MKIIKSLLLISSSVSLSAFAMKPGVEPIQLSECIILPISNKGPLEIDLEINIPPTFRQSRMEKVPPNIRKPAVLEWRDFIPATATPETWTEMIVTQKFFINSNNAKELINNARNAFISCRPNVEILTETTAVCATHLAATLTTLYNEPTHNNRRELFYVSYFSNFLKPSAGIYGFQYTIALSQDNTRAVSHALEKIDQFVKNNTRFTIGYAPSVDHELLERMLQKAKENKELNS